MLGYRDEFIRFDSTSLSTRSIRVCCSFGKLNIFKFLRIGSSSSISVLFLKNAAFLIMCPQTGRQTNYPTKMRNLKNWETGSCKLRVQWTQDNLSSKTQLGTCNGNDYEAKKTFLVETKRTLNADLQVVQLALVVFGPNRSNYTGRIACQDCESLCLKYNPSLFRFLRCTPNFLQKFFKKGWGVFESIFWVSEKRDRKWIESF